MHEKFRKLVPLGHFDCSLPLMKHVFHPSICELIIRGILQYSVKHETVGTDRTVRLVHSVSWQEILSLKFTALNLITIHDLRTDISQALFTKLPVIARFEILTAITEHGVLIHQRIIQSTQLSFYYKRCICFYTSLRFNLRGHHYVKIKRSCVIIKAFFNLKNP
jgi:hypothetical protein